MSESSEKVEASACPFGHHSGGREQERQITKVIVERLELPAGHALSVDLRCDRGVWSGTVKVWPRRSPSGSNGKGEGPAGVAASDSEGPAGPRRHGATPVAPSGAAAASVENGGREVSRVEALEWLTGIEVDAATARMLADSFEPEEVVRVCQLAEGKRSPSGYAVVTLMRRLQSGGLGR